MKKISLSFLAIVLMTSCSRTNKLAEYDVSNSKMYFEEFVSPEARTIKIETHESTSEKNDAESILETIAGIGSDIVTTETILKIKKWVDTKSLIKRVSEELQEVLYTYINMEPVKSREDYPQFITETIFEDCVLAIDKSSIFIRLKANSRMIDRNTGIIIWENGEVHVLPIEDQEYYKTDNKDSKPLTKVLNAIRLASLSQNEPNFYLGEAVKIVGRKMAETFREDLSEIPR